MQQQIHVGALLRHHQLPVADIQIGGVGFHIPVPVRALDRRDRHELVGIGARYRGGPAEGIPDLGTACGLQLGFEHGIRLGEMLLVDDAALIQIVHPGDRLLILIGGRHIERIAVVVQGHIVTGTAGDDAEGSQNVPAVHQQTTAIGIGDLVIRVAVAVGVPILEGFQYRLQLLVGIRHL